METDAEIYKVRPLVEAILRKYPQTRNSDSLLIHQCWLQIDPTLASRPLIPTDFEILPHFETVRRLRQKIQNTEGQLLPTDPEVFKRRRLREEDFRRIFGRGFEEP